MNDGNKLRISIILPFKEDKSCMAKINSFHHDDDLDC